MIDHVRCVPVTLAPGHTVYLSETEIFRLSGVFQRLSAEIIQRRADARPGIPDDYDDLQLEKDFAAGAKPRKKRAERLDDKAEVTPSS